MRSFIICDKYANRRIDRLLTEKFVNMPSGAMHKAFRKKDIKVNGIRVDKSYIVCFGDKVEVYITDDILDGIPLKNDPQSKAGFSVVYEDSNILIADKRQGIPVHPDREKSAYTLIDGVSSYMREKGGYNPDDPSSFAPSLCHRIDRNTSGLVIIAKNAPSLKIMLDKIKKKEVRKYYQCLVRGIMEKENDELRAYLVKDKIKSRVFISETCSRGARQIITQYRVISYLDGISKLEVELITGRTHQIRAHLAYIGHPVIGDGKYGNNSYNRSLGITRQALCAHKIVFDFKDGGLLNYLTGKKFEAVPGF